MTHPTIRVGDASHSGPTQENSQAETAWRLLAALGIVFLAVGLADICVAWVPPRFGSPEWEFGTITATLNNLPVPAMGLVLLLSSGVALERRSQVILALLLAVVLILILLLMSVLYGLTAPLAWKAGAAAVGRSAIGGAIAKSLTALVAYFSLGVICITFAARDLRHR